MGKFQPMAISVFRILYGHWAKVNAVLLVRPRGTTKFERSIIGKNFKNSPVGHEHRSKRFPKNIQNCKKIPKNISRKDKVSSLFKSHQRISNKRRFRAQWKKLKAQNTNYYFFRNFGLQFREQCPGLKTFSQLRGKGKIISLHRFSTN